jgi:hypothetical protein
MDRRVALASALVVGWVAVVGAALWAFELRYQLPADTARRVATQLKLDRPVPRAPVAPDGASPFSLGEPGGPLTVLHFWDAGCASAALNAPIARDIAARYRAKGVRFVVVAAGGPDDRAKAAQAFGAPVVADPDGRLASAVGAYAVPFAAVVDGEGRLRHAGTYHLGANCGVARPEPVELALDALIAGKPLPERPIPNIGCPLPERGGRTASR